MHVHVYVCLCVIEMKTNYFLSYQQIMKFVVMHYYKYVYFYIIAFTVVVFSFLISVKQGRIK